MQKTEMSRHLRPHAYPLSLHTGAYDLPDGFQMVYRLPAQLWLGRPAQSFKAAIRPPPSGIRPPVSDLRYPLSGLRYPLSVLRYPSSVRRCPLSGIRSPKTVIRVDKCRYPLSVIRRPLSVVRHPLSENRYPLSESRFPGAVPCLAGRLRKLKASLGGTPCHRPSYPR